MRSSVATLGSTVVLLALLLTKAGCGNGFLGLQDYQRDLIGLGGLTWWLLNTDTTGNGDPVAGEPIPGQTGDPGPAGADGADGQTCWDLNGNGTADLPDEDTNGDGVVDVFDCAGVDGASGSDGSAGASGQRCWDLNGNGRGDLATEDSNGDGVVNVADCDGQDGAAGGGGGGGAAGPDGDRTQLQPKLFSILVDDFFTVLGSPEGDLTVRVVPISEPALGLLTPRGEQQGGVIGFRVGLPNSYRSPNPVTMRLFFQITGEPNRDCLVFSVNAARLRNRGSVEQHPDTRYVRVLTDDVENGNGDVPAIVAGLDQGLAFVVDLPINVGSPNALDEWTGLGFWDDLSPADFLAFELGTDREDGRLYHLLAVEFFETTTTRVENASIFGNNDFPCRQITDCNENGVPDDIDIEEGTSFDCDENGVPDECASCPSMDVVFIMDTSGSMDDEAAALCNSIQDVVNDLAARGIEVNPTFLGITENSTTQPDFTCLPTDVSAQLGNAVPGNNGTCPADLTAPGHPDESERDENWAPATAIVAERFPWTPGAVRVIVPISDEGPCLGDDCEIEGADSDAIDNAIAIANLHEVVVSPITGTGSDECVLALAERLATSTGGRMFESTDPEADLAGAISVLLEDACRLFFDCNANETPDVCELVTPDEGVSGPGGSVFLTGHDPDFHASLGGNLTGARNTNNRAIDFVMDAQANTFVRRGVSKFLYVQSRINPPNGHTNGLNGIIASGHVLGTDFDHHDATTLNAALDELGTTYAAIVVASDYGGILTQAELDILNARAADIIAFLNAGGGLYALAESNSQGQLTPNGGHFGFLPFVVSSTQFNQTEIGVTVTPFGASLGLTNDDVNGNASHNIFVATSGLNIVDVDSSGNILSLAARGVINPELGFVTDCNRNGVLDECEIERGDAEDCNQNGIPDECDIATGFSDDCQENGIPDECNDGCEPEGFTVLFRFPAGLAEECNLLTGTVLAPFCGAVESDPQSKGGEMITCTGVPAGTQVTLDDLSVCALCWDVSPDDLFECEPQASTVLEINEDKDIFLVIE